ncbi:hypothetical protein PYH37_004466 [Sinorhizobium numidicum]|uniref:Uncharacterized protein n=1 Tax=Sinorhizobium numidicum TaxID=680248 RepID=A0ABY8D308_9HYPH|nr:hypothetical protein [Sinorhizobium numidicum]WEX79280.1 hypothetical protein PYH37_004466 [Sinorhizobium numidicum]WEX85264.1 hypothetical protein PYH38_005178 [Sinorhizobium numidicum]
MPDWGFAADRGFNRAQAQAEFEKFRDYWTAKAGRDAVKLDWPATWRNWIRNAGRAPPVPRGGFREHQDDVQRQLDRALGRSRDDEFTGTTLEF